MYLALATPMTSSKMSSLTFVRRHLRLHPISYSIHTVSESPPTTMTSSEDTAVKTAVSILTHQRSKSRWSTLMSVFPDGLSGVQISQIMLHIRNNPHLALHFFQFTTRRFRSNAPSLHSYATIIHILARARLKSRAQFLIKEAILLSPDHFELFKVLVDTYRVCDSAPFVFDLLIKSLLEYNKIDSCLRILRVLTSRGNHVNVATCNALISACSKHKGCFFGYDLYKDIFYEGKVLPNVHTFNDLMLSFHKGGVLDMVEQIWIEMVKRNCTPNCYSYTILMEAYCEDGDINKARNVWDEFKSKGLDPDIVAYNTMIRGHCKAGDVENGEELYKQMVLSGVEPSCVTYQHLINGYCLARDTDSAMLLYKDMRRKGYCPDTYTVDVMVNVLCDKGCAIEALGFFTLVMDNADFVARETSYEKLIKGLCGVGKMEEALKLQAQMVGKGFRPNANIYGIFIDGYMKRGQSDMADSLRKEIMATLPDGVGIKNQSELPA